MNRDYAAHLSRNNSAEGNHELREPHEMNVFVPI
jgi:hypothetical protein